MPELFKFGPDHKLLLALGDKELGAHQDKAHGLRVDAARQCVDLRRQRRDGEENKP